MKVKELKKINEFAHINHFNIDYECLLQIQEKDISKILDLIDLKSTNVESLIHFLTYEVDVSDWEHGFAHMKGIENFNIREYIIEKITNAPSKIVSDLIYRYFDLNDGKASHLDLFNDINEYQAYIENITDQMAENEELVISNIMLVLEKVSFTDDRSELIKKTMIYSQKKELLPESLNACFEKLFHIELTPYFSEILLLLLKGYKIGTVCNFFRKWHEDAKSREKDKVNESYEFVEKYFRKGSRMLMTGRIQNDNYTNSNGEKVYSVQIIAEEIEFAERKSTADANAAQGGNFGGGAPQPNAAANDDFMNIPDGIEDGLPFN